MNHWHNGDTDSLPRRLMASMRADRVGTDQQPELRYQIGAGSYEDRFRYFWLVVAWSMLVYQGTIMAISAVQMMFGVLSYLWLAHLVCTTVVFVGFGFAALVYRLVLFPAPGYYSRGMPDLLTKGFQGAPGAPQAPAAPEAATPPAAAFTKPVGVPQAPQARTAA